MLGYPVSCVGAKLTRKVNLDVSAGLFILSTFLLRIEPLSLSVLVMRSRGEAARLHLPLLGEIIPLLRPRAASLD